ncbi:somatomedin B and thrombospondin type 1 domain containing [Cricetulus griseus]
MRTLWMVLCALARLWPGALAGCTEAGRCCPGRDPACFARGWRLDRVYGTCFCDQACRLTGDCCFDYDRACPGGWLGPGRGHQPCNPSRRAKGRAQDR